MKPYPVSAEAIGQAILALAGGGGTAVGAKHDVTGAPPATGLIHGPGGLLSYPGVDPLVFHTVVGYKPGVMNSIPTRPSRFMSPLFEMVTGIKAEPEGQSEIDGPCDDAPYGGPMKAGMVTFPFGRYDRSTRQIELNRIGQLNDRAEPMDLQLVGSAAGPNPFGDPANGAFPQGAVLRNEVAVVMQERAVALNRILQRQIWRGNPANNAAGGGYKEFAGLELLIQPNWRDALTGLALPSLYPRIRDFNYQRIDGACDAAVNEITYMARYTRDLAERTGVGPVRWAFAMRPALFYELTKCWPCSYYTQLCTFGNQATTDIVQNISLTDQTAMRDDMRTNLYLMIDGERWDVILDDTITEYTTTTDANVTEGCFASDIYLLSMSVAGRASLYFDYFDYNNPDLQSALAIGLGPLVRVLGGGAWLETFRQTNFCVEWQAKIEPRLILRTPWLCGRLENVQYCPLYANRHPDPIDPYWTNGGEVSRPGPSYYPPYDTSDQR